MLYLQSIWLNKKIKKTASCEFLWQAQTCCPPWGRLTSTEQIKVTQNMLEKWKNYTQISPHVSHREMTIRAAVYTDAQLGSCIYIHGFHISFVRYCLLPALHTESSVIIVAMTTTTRTKNRSESAIKDE